MNENVLKLLIKRVVVIKNGQNVNDKTFFDVWHFDHIFLVASMV